MDTRPVEVDFEVYKKIALERTSFEETENEALRRLLKLPPRQRQMPEPDAQSSGGKAWLWKGAYLPHGTALRMQYNGQVHTGEISNGEWAVEGYRCKSPSDAAGAVAKTKTGERPSLNGWNYWEFKRPGETAWTQVSEIRKK